MATVTFDHCRVADAYPPLGGTLLIPATVRSTIRLFLPSRGLGVLPIRSTIAGSFLTGFDHPCTLDHVLFAHPTKAHFSSATSRATMYFDVRPLDDFTCDHEGIHLMRVPSQGSRTIDVSLRLGTGPWLLTVRPSTACPTAGGFQSSTKSAQIPT